MVMDIDELILETLKIIEDREITASNAPCLYTCISGQIDHNNNNVFSDIVETGDTCVFASSYETAACLFFFMEGFFNHGKQKGEWYTKCLHEWVKYYRDDEFDGEITADIAFKIWSQNYHGCITEHQPTQSIIIDPTPNSVVSISPTICDIWTLPRVRQQFID